MSGIMVLRWSRSVSNYSLVISRALTTSARSSIFVKRSSKTTNKVKEQETKKNNEVVTLLKKVHKKRKKDTTDETKRSNILFLEIQDAIKVFQQKYSNLLSIEQIKTKPELIEKFLWHRNRPEVIIPSVEIIYQSSEGHGLGIIPTSLYGMPYVTDQEDIFDQFTVVVVPNTIIGDKAKVVLLTHQEYYAESSMLELVQPSIERNDELVVCEKFNDCTGCQFQMLPYDEQLSNKQRFVQRAYQFFYPDLLKDHPELLAVGKVFGSPLEYGYRHKLTPHYKIPRNYGGEKFAIGFDNPNPGNQVTDIQHCYLASPIINENYGALRDKHLDMAQKLPLNSRTKTGGLMIRESLKLNEETKSYDKICLDGGKKIVTEMVEDKLFQFELSTFFQVNTHILPLVFDFIRGHMKSSSHDFKYLVDSYCGAGLFGICLAKDLPEGGKVFGIEIDKSSTDNAASNAKLNNLSVPDKIEFINGNADLMFQSPEFLASGIVGNQSIVIMDPSRKGSSNLFLKQLLEFKPKMIVYVSCNVFTQARDLATFNQFQKLYNTNYKIKELVGFDFFPQTRHVETVAILELKD